MIISCDFAFDNEIHNRLMTTKEINLCKPFAKLSLKSKQGISQIAISEWGKKYRSIRVLPDTYIHVTTAVQLWVANTIGSILSTAG